MKLYNIILISITSLIHFSSECDDSNIAITSGECNCDFPFIIKNKAYIDLYSKKLSETFYGQVIIDIAIDETEKVSFLNIKKANLTTLNNETISFYRYSTKELDEKAYPEKLMDIFRDFEQLKKDLIIINTDPLCKLKGLYFISIPLNIEKSPKFSLSKS